MAYIKSIHLNDFSHIKKKKGKLVKIRLYTLILSHIRISFPH